MAFTELPFGQEGLVLPSQAVLQQQLSGLSQFLQGMRQYMEGVKDQRQKEFVASTSFAIDPTITETAQRQKMIEDVEEYVIDAKKLYAESDGEFGYLRLSPQQQVKLQNRKNDLVGKQSQRMAAQAAYAAQYKEFNDPKNIGLYDANKFAEQAKKFQSGEIVTDFLKPYPINTKKYISDLYASVYKLNKEDMQMKSVGMGSKAGLKTQWTSSLFGDIAPSSDQINQVIAESLYQNYYQDPKFNLLVNLDLEPYGAAFRAQLEQDPEKFRKYLADNYAEVVKPHLYSQEYTSPTNIKSGGTTVNVSSGGSGDGVNILYNNAISGYNFSGRGGKGGAAPIPYDGDVPTEFYVLNKSKLASVSMANQPPVEAFKNAKITGVIKKEGKVYAAMSVPKVEEYQEEGVFGGTTTKKRLSLDKTQVYYVPYSAVESVIRQSGYNLEGWDDFYREDEVIYGTPAFTGTGTLTNN